MKEIMTGEPLPLGRMPGGGFSPMPAAERARRDAEAEREQAAHDERAYSPRYNDLRARIARLIAGDEVLREAPAPLLARALKANPATVQAWQSADA